MCEFYTANVKGIFGGPLSECVWQQAITCCSCYRMPQNAFFTMNSRSSGQPNKRCKDLFPHHPLSPVISATATVLAFVLLHNSRFNFHCYTQREATPSQKSARKGHCDLSRLLAREVTKGIRSCKPASLNRPIGPVNRRHFVSPLTQNCVNPDKLDTLQQKKLSFPFLQTVVSSKKQKQANKQATGGNTQPPLL